MDEACSHRKLVAGVNNTCNTAVSIPANSRCLEFCMRMKSERERSEEIARWLGTETNRGIEVKHRD